MLEIEDFRFANEGRRPRRLNGVDIRPGLWRVEWKNGGVSLASIGMNEKGDWWLAPCNWSSPSTPLPIDDSSRTSWSNIEAITPVDLPEEKVRVNGVVYPVRWDGSQLRFKEDPDNPLRKRLRELRGAINFDGDIKDLNEMAERYNRGEFTKWEYAEFNMALGYSVYGFEELTTFKDWEIEVLNPVPVISQQIAPGTD